MMKIFNIKLDEESPALTKINFS